MIRAFLISAAFAWSPAMAAEPAPIQIGNAAVYHEYMDLRHQTQWLAANNQVDGVVGGLMLTKGFQDHSIFWTPADSLDGSQTIRLMRARPSGEVFAVSFYFGPNIVPGRLVVRRVIGPEPVGWRADTVDFQTGQLIDVQGVEAPVLFPEEVALLRSRSIALPPAPEFPTFNWDELLEQRW